MTSKTVPFPVRRHRREHPDFVLHSIRAHTDTGLSIGFAVGKLGSNSRRWHCFSLCPDLRRSILVSPIRVRSLCSVRSKPMIAG